MLAGDLNYDTSPWWNSAIPTDVDGDGSTTPTDALLIINEINGYGSRSLVHSSAATDAHDPTVMVDVDADKSVTPTDALLVINRLNVGTGEGEGTTTVQYTILPIAAGTQSVVSGQPVAPLTSITVGQDYDLVV
jgi:hypothetical protein